MDGFVPILPEMASASSSRRSPTADLGKRAEHLVGQWLTALGWELLYHRWHCRWGELDWVALTPKQEGQRQELVFLEVKARRRRNWDADGLLALTSQKQAKLWQAAELFLMEHPHLADLGCRFDVVLVEVSGAAGGDRPPAHLTIRQHIPNAFGQ